MPQTEMRFHKLMLVATLLICVGLPACAIKHRMSISPDIPKLTGDAFRIKGIISYDGNKDYLPCTIVDEATSNSQLTFQYVHATSYGKRDVPDLIALYNPLTVLGFPLGENTVTTVGKLSIMKGNEFIKSYSAICSIEITRHIFSEGNTFSQMRRGD